MVDRLTCGLDQWFLALGALDLELPGSFLKKKKKSPHNEMSKDLNRNLKNVAYILSVIGTNKDMGQKEFPNPAPRNLN